MQDRRLSGAEETAVQSSHASPYIIEAQRDLINKGVIIRDAGNSKIIGTKNVFIDKNIIIKNPHAHSAASSEVNRAFSVPLPRNSNFSGRDGILAELHDQIYDVLPTDESEEQQLRSCLVYGTAGLGKTQVALEYCYRHERSYDIIFWLQAEESGKLFNGMVDMLRKLKLPGEENNGAIVEILQGWLQATKNKWLLVFDNAEDWKTLEPFWPRTTHGSVIITSQHDILSDLTTSSIALERLNKSEGPSLLLKHLKKHQRSIDNEDDANLLCEELGGLPLAIAQVAGYITKSRSSIPGVLAKLRKRSTTAKLFETGHVPSFQYDKTLGDVWDVALQELDEDAQTVLQVLSMLDADGVPESLLFGDGEGASLLRSMDPESVIINLTTRQLVTVSDVTGKKTYSTHRALQKSIQLRLDKNGKFQHIFKVAFALIREKFPRQSSIQLPQNNNWEICKQFSSHIMSLRKVYETSDKEDPWLSIQFVQLLGDVANYYWERNLSVAGLEACETAERICAKLPGQFLSERADIYTLSIGLREHHGISGREAARYRYEKSLALRQQYINNLSPASATNIDADNYANAWHNFSCILMDYGLYGEALEYLELAICIRGSIGEPASINGQSDLYRSICLLALGRCEQALEVVQSLEATIRELPSEALETVSVALIPFRFHWAEVYLATGDVEGAYTRMVDVLASRSEYFGVRGRATLDAYYMLGVIEQERGNMDVAENFFRTALGFARPGEWTEEAEARTLFWLGRLLVAKGKGEEAESYLKIARKTKEKLWKPTSITDSASIDEEEVFDYMVPYGSGRPKIAKKGLIGRQSTETDNTCRQLKSKIEAACVDGKILRPSELVKLMRVKGFSGEEVIPHKRMVLISKSGLSWLIAVLVPLLWFLFSYTVGLSRIQ